MMDTHQEANQPEVLTDTQREKLDTLGQVLCIRIDGDCDDAMINTAFDHLEGLLFRVQNDEPPPERQDEPSVKKQDSNKSNRSSKRSGSRGRPRGGRR